MCTSVPDLIVLVLVHAIVVSAVHRAQFGRRRAVVAAPTSPSSGSGNASSAPSVVVTCLDALLRSSTVGTRFVLLAILVRVTVVSVACALFETQTAPSHTLDIGY